MHWGVGPALHLGRKMAASGAGPQILVQYLVLRKDLSQAPFSWPAGAVVAQACHAATAALHLHRDHPHTAAYLRELGRMRKVVLEVRCRAGQWGAEHIRPEVGVALSLGPNFVEWLGRCGESFTSKFRTRVWSSSH